MKEGKRALPQDGRDVFKGRNGVGFAELPVAMGGGLRCDYARQWRVTDGSECQWSVGCATLGYPAWTRETERCAEAVPAPNENLATECIDDEKRMDSSMLFKLGNGKRGQREVNSRVLSYCLLALVSRHSWRFRRLPAALEIKVGASAGGRPLFRAPVVAKAERQGCLQFSRGLYS